ncbi:hypothetical protein HPB52_024658 [Rhipicephalus sanguineus]|uniref:Uncharacterized protein n=1 Tax=Rhipicephalus sanguineus TaxID=34632 RepID=A0A9D4SN32_RHISA|nr:hypothetical protein HPB52_024658 [Rhipicephalus sanguineus]
MLANLPKKPKSHPPGQEVKQLGNIAILYKVEGFLRLGPKFCLAPKLDKVEALSLVRAAARKATAPEADHVVFECIEALPSKLASSGRINLRGIVSSLQEKNYKLLQSDKEGAFVVVHPDQYRLLSDKALNENFKTNKEGTPFRVIVAEAGSWERVVKKGIEEHGVVRFENTIGTSASRFEELLVLYLRSTAVEHNG